MLGVRTMEEKTFTDHAPGGLKYVTITGVPLRKVSGYEGIHAQDIELYEKAIARRIITEGVPLRGAEVRFLRKELGLSFDRFAAAFDMTGAGVKKWEEDLEKRLSPTNEVAVRAWLAEQFGVRLEGKFSSLLGQAETPREWVMDYRDIVRASKVEAKVQPTSAAEVEEVLARISELTQKARELASRLEAEGKSRGRSRLIR